MSAKKVDLSVEFCGKKFLNPFMLSSSPVSNSAEMVGRSFDAGWGGVAGTLFFGDRWDRGDGWDGGDGWGRRDSQTIYAAGWLPAPSGRARPTIPNCLALGGPRRFLTQNEERRIKNTQ